MGFNLTPIPLNLRVDHNRVRPQGPLDDCGKRKVLPTFVQPRRLQPHRQNCSVSIIRNARVRSVAGEDYLPQIHRPPFRAGILRTPNRSSATNLSWIQGCNTPVFMHSSTVLAVPHPFNDRAIQSQDCSALFEFGRVSFVVWIGCQCDSILFSPDSLRLRLHGTLRVWKVLRRFNAFEHAVIAHVAGAAVPKLAGLSQWPWCPSGGLFGRFPGCQ
jgi:hypothetical protein